MVKPVDAWRALPDLLVAAEYIAGYAAMVNQTQKRRNEVCSAIQAADVWSKRRKPSPPRGGDKSGKP